MQITTSEWRYRAEGNANIVFGFIGHSPRLKGLVLRVRKERPSKVASVLLENHFHKHLVPHILPGFVPNETLVRVSPSTLSLLSTSSRPFRPHHRRDTNIDTTQQFALLIPDLSLPPPQPHLSLNQQQHQNIHSLPQSLMSSLPQHFLPFSSSLCIEIKPKCGVKSRDSKACHYCMTQYWKLEQGTINEISHYCPLDLFSRDPTRITTALNALCDNPQNNFAIFQGGETVSTDGLDAHARRWVIAAVTLILADSPILNMLKSLQSLHRAPLKTLDSIYKEICGRNAVTKLASWWGGDAVPVATTTPTTTTPTPTTNGTSGNEEGNKSKKGEDKTKEEVSELLSGETVSRWVSLSVTDWVVGADVGSTWLATTDQCIGRLPLGSTLLGCSLIHHFPVLADAVSSFLIATAAKDVSVMIQMWQIEGKGFAKVNVVDVAPKTPLKLPVYVQLEQEITAAFERGTKNKNTTK